MERERLIKLYTPDKDIHEEIERCLLTEGGHELIGFIIDDILPAVRDKEEFQRDFRDWMHENHFWEMNAFVFRQMLLGYELEYCREILAVSGQRWKK